MLIWVGLAILLGMTVLISLGIGRYHVDFFTVVKICWSRVYSSIPTWTDTDERVVLLIRMPRILMAVFAGAGLALSGAGLQGVFRNPLVGPQIIGVSSGAAFGGVLAILIWESQILTILTAFVFGLIAVVIVFIMSRTNGRSPVLMLVLSGVVVSAFFTALISLAKYVADPYDQLPAIVFWLMGSLALITYSKVVIAGIPILLAGAVIYMIRFRINILSLGDEEAESLGIKVGPTRWVLILCATLITSAVVSVCGIIGWVGLVIPHVARMITGPDHRILFPASALIGSIFFLLVDDIARGATQAEIPVGILTAIIGAPVFAVLLKRTHAGGWKND